MNLLEEVKSLEEELIKHRRNLHRIPETGLHLPETKEYIKRKLEGLGLKIVESKTTSGIMGILENGSGKVLAVRSDMDALPIREQTGLPFASTNGNMHACGHDAHMAIVLTVAKILKNHRDRINGVVKFIFQPGEEKEGGAKYLVEEGFLKEPHVDAILGIHVGNFIEEADNGQIGLF
ncbi:MAG TPA: amidohydrolase, partial [Firmicutes bacterium]|nr:amidohydrolase [Bacillota bacterium]